MEYNSDSLCPIFAKLYCGCMFIQETKFDTSDKYTKASDVHYCGVAHGFKHVTKLATDQSRWGLGIYRKDINVTKYEQETQRSDHNVT